MNPQERRQIVIKMRKQGWPLHVIEKRLDYLDNCKPHPPTYKPDEVSVFKALAVVSFIAAVVLWLAWL